MLAYDARLTFILLSPTDVRTVRPPSATLVSLPPAVVLLMSRLPLLGAAICLVAGLCQSGSCAAQDMRVYTTVADLRADPSSPEVIARSLTLFHAGRVYDHMEDVGEVVIFEPTAKRFVLIGNNLTATSVQLEEMQHYLGVGVKEAARYAAELAPDQPDAAAALQFQLKPQFDISFDLEKHLLQLRSPFLAYDVTTAAGPSVEQVQRYLEYTDQAAQLNFLLSPNSLMPAPRMALNAELQSRQRLPVTVDLKSRVDGDRHLRATHKYQWELQAYDRTQISKWERLLESDSLRWVEFRQYQQAQLTVDAK